MGVVGVRSPGRHVNRLVIDIETYSSVELTQSGVYAYSESPDFEVLMCAWRVRGMKRAELVFGHEAIAQIPGLWDPKVTKVAHNAQFERVCLSRMAGMPTGRYLPPNSWECSMAVAALAGLPRSLAGLATALGAPPKDEDGRRLIQLFSKPYRGRRLRPEDRPEDWEKFGLYCIQDVDTLYEADLKLPGWSASERRYWIIDQKINDRGMKVDLEQAHVAIEADAQNQETSGRDLAELLQIDNPGSVVQVKKGLEGIGLELPNLRAETIEHALGTDLTADQRLALEMRQDLALVAAKKYQAAINAASTDGRLRGQFLYHGAHTGRWSSKGVQVQNLPRATIHANKAKVIDLALELGLDWDHAEELADEQERMAALEQLMLTGRADPFILKALIRAMFVGPFVVADYAAIEARVLAWVAHEEWALEAFQAGRDIYVETAQRMGGLTRQQGKVAVLASGYQGGVHSLRKMGATGTDEELDFMKVQWRKANPNIVRLWSTLESKFLHGGQAGRLYVDAAGGTRKLFLPSGRPLVYRGVRQERWSFEDPETGERKSRSGIRFQGHSGRTDTYGGRLVENAVQAISRDLLADAMYRLEQAGIQVVGHIHDEVICENGTADEVAEIMGQAPGWAEGLPLGAVGFTCERYRKG